MSQPDVKDLLAAAEQALAEGDLADADALLRDVARIEEATLGPLHPDLAATMSNLAIVAEKAGRQPDAERYYRRAAAIASASLPKDDPMVAATRENLQDFCRLHGLPLDVEPPAPPAVEPSAPPAVEPPAPRAMEKPAPPNTDRGIDRVIPAPKVDRGIDRIIPAPKADRGIHRAARDVPAEAVSTPAIISATAPPPATESGSRKWIVIAVVILAAVAFLVMRWSSRDESTPVPPEESAARPADPRRAAPAEPPAVAAPRNEAPASPVVPPRNDRGAAASKPAARTSSSGSVTIISAELCRTFSASGANWQCKPAGDVVAPGRIVLFTKIKSQRDVTVTHRWYRGNSLRQSVRLRISPNGTAGYRTYSRQTAGPGEWRVEVRSAAGDLLNEKRFIVR